MLCVGSITFVRYEIVERYSRVSASLLRGLFESN